MSAGQRGFFSFSFSLPLGRCPQDRGASSFLNPTLSGASHADKSAVVATCVNLTTLTPAPSRNLRIYEFTNLRICSIRRGLRYEAGGLGRSIPLNPPSPRGTSADEALKRRENLSPLQGFRNMHALLHRALPYANGSEPFRLKNSRNLPQ